MIKGVTFFENQYDVTGSETYGSQELMLPVTHKPGATGRKQDALDTTLALIYEADDLDAETQEEIINTAIDKGFKKHILSVTWSGNKSYHTLIRINERMTPAEHAAVWREVGFTIFGSEAMRHMDKHGATLNAMTRTPGGIRHFGDGKTAEQVCYYSNDEAEIFDCTKILKRVRMSMYRREQEQLGRIQTRRERVFAEYDFLSHIDNLINKYPYRENYKIAKSLYLGDDPGQGINLKSVIGTLVGSGVDDIDALKQIARNMVSLHPSNTGNNGAENILNDILNRGDIEL